MKMCCKCHKRPAVVFMQETDPSSIDNKGEVKGLCLVCASESGIKPIDNLLKSMNISEEDIQQMSDQFAEMMGDINEDELEEMEENAFSFGGAQTFPFLNNLFGGENAKENLTDSAEEKTKESKKKKQKRRKYLEQYCTNLTDKARNGQLDVIIGRDNELYRTIQILSRRSKNNPCLIGEPGVGKTAIAEGLAIKIASGNAPSRLLDKEIHLLDLTGLVAGTQFRGQFESRVKGLVEEVKEAGNIILFIDEIHNLVGAGDSTEGSMNAANILKPALSRGEIQVIGATTFKEYRKYIEKDAALERRFQPVTINEPSVEDTYKVLLGIKSYYEGYHNVKVDDSIILSSVKLSERYITDRYLPDKAIDLLDEACACASLRNKFVDELYTINKKIADLNEEKVALEQNVNDPNYERLATIKADLAKYNEKANALYLPASNNSVTEDDLARVIELWTGIPAVKVKESNLEKLSGLKERISSKIIGQDDAVDSVSAGVRRTSVQISSHRRPVSFIFVGPTGVGKTELVKVLAEELFDTPETLIRLDMSEYMEKHSVAKLIGAPPGYVGYDDAGQLTEKVRRKPYSVILFDEIEKAHSDVLNIMLQILDDGRITDSQGRTVNFENTIIVMTSNAGSDKSDSLMGFGKTINSASKEKAVSALEEFLRPEFLGRVDDIVVFNKLTEDNLVKIADLILNELKKSLLDKSINLSWSNDVCVYISKKCNSDKSGARDIRRIVRKEIEDKIVNTMIDNRKKVLTDISVSAKDEIAIEYKFL